MQSSGHKSKTVSILVLLTCAGSLFLNGCSWLNPFGKETNSAKMSATGKGVVQTVKPDKLFGIMPVYRPDIQQGNFISREMVAQLKTGMTKEQVTFLLGTPLLIDVFHTERWDYPFRLKKGDGQVTTSSVTVIFENDRVAKFEGGDLPSEKDYLMQIAAPKN
jgi:outer membrane protein assembly factor BamE